MGNFKRDGRFGGGGDRFGGRGSSGRGFNDRGHDRQMHKAICGKCGQECEVPFKPTGERPVFCRNCFKRDEGATPQRFGDRDTVRPAFSEKRMFEATCAKCGKWCEVPFRPTGEKPTYCRDCFGGKADGGPARGADQLKVQFDMLNVKLDRILKALSSCGCAAVKDERPAVKVEKPAVKVEAPAKFKKAAEALAEPARAVEVNAGSKNSEEVQAEPKKADSKKAPGKKASAKKKK